MDRKWSLLVAFGAGVVLLGSGVQPGREPGRPVLEL